MDKRKLKRKTARSTKPTSGGRKDRGLLACSHGELSEGIAQQTNANFMRNAAMALNVLSSGLLFCGAYSTHCSCCCGFLFFFGIFTIETFKAVHLKSFFLYILKSYVIAIVEEGSYEVQLKWHSLEA